MLLSKIIDTINYNNIINFKDLDINSIEYDSRDIKNGALFFAIKGRNYVENNFSGDDGHKYIFNAIECGAKAIVVNEEFSFKDEYKDMFLKTKSLNIPLIFVNDTNIEVSKAGAYFYNYPSMNLNVIGITGTNGKTSSSYLLERIFKDNGIKTGVIGSVSYRLDDEVIDNVEYTTPKSLYFQKAMSKMLKKEISHFICEVSSHGIDFNRVNDIDFDIAVFTNLTRDHLEYHETMENYFNTKKRLFTELLVNSKKKDKYAIINIDSEYGKKLYEVVKFIKEVKTITYGFSEEAQVKVSDYDIEGGLSKFLVNINGAEQSFKLNLVGKHNIYNALLSIVVSSMIYNISLENISLSLENVKAVSGRLERVSKDYNIFVDYAHTVDALNNVLLSLKSSFKNNKIITVFGCGGNRDKGKRPKMGRIVTDLSDYTYITSDNPRYEDPEKIIESVSAGVKNGFFEVVLDRKDAVKKAIHDMDLKKDVLLIAGKGHETYQEIKGEKIYFDDKKFIREILKSNL